MKMNNIKIIHITLSHFSSLVNLVLLVFPSEISLILTSMEEEDDLDGWSAGFLEDALKGFAQPPPPAPAIVPAPAPAPAPAISTISSSLTHAVQFQPPGHRKQIPLHDPLSFSPPRVLSQRVSGYDDAPMDHSTSSAAPAASSCSSTRRCDSEKDLEIDRLKVRVCCCCFVLYLSLVCSFLNFVAVFVM